MSNCTASLLEVFNITVLTTTATRTPDGHAGTAARSHKLSGLARTAATPPSGSIEEGEDGTHIDAPTSRPTSHSYSSTTTTAATAAAATALRKTPPLSAPSVGGFAVVNMTDAYAVAGWLGRAGEGGRLARGFVLVANLTQLLVVDEIMIPASAAGDVARVRWAVHTYTDVTLTSPSGNVTLTSKFGVAVTLALLPGPATMCPGATWSVTPLDLPLPSESTKGCSVVTLHAPAASCSRIAVLVGVGVDAVGGMAPLRPLGQWSEGGPFVA